MRHPARYTFVLVSLLALVVGCGGGSTEVAPPVEPAWETTLLDTFVADKTGYAWEPLWTNTTGGIETHALDVTSQIWRTTEELDRIVWNHDVGIAWPEGTAQGVATVVIFGGSNGSHIEPDDSDLEYLGMIAELTGCPAVGIGQIPNQPLTVIGSGGPRKEDDLVAATWDRAVVTGDPTWSAYFAMTRASVRCMDSVQEYAAGLGRPIDRFLVTGFSKRGAATYLTTAVDRRVVAMMPGVFDFLNYAPQAAHHLAVYGEPAAAVDSYAEFGLLDRFDDPLADALLDHSDPYVYRTRLTMPKLIVASTGDQFFLPDAMRFYIDDIPGDTLVRYVPNTGHSLDQEGGDLLQMIAGALGWQERVRSGLPTPDLAWTHSSGQLALTATPQPDEVKLWQATNPAARDFRIDVLGAVWTSTEVPQGLDGRYTVDVQAPAEGWTAFLLEAWWGEEAYTTQVYVTPDVYPSHDD